MLIEDIKTLIFGYHDFKRANYHLPPLELQTQAEKTIGAIFDLVKRNNKHRRKFYKHKRQFNQVASTKRERITLTDNNRTDGQRGQNKPEVSGLTKQSC